MKSMEKARAMMDQAYECLDSGDLGKSRKIAKELVAMGFSGGYEILACCFQAEDKPKKAIEILKEGTKKVPLAWPLWRQLGNMYSDMKEYDLAHKTYETALGCPNVSQGPINFDRSLAFYRDSRYFEALELLDALPDEWRVRSAPLKASVLNALHRYDTTIELCRTVLDSTLSALDDTKLTPQDICNLHVELAMALDSNGNKSEALETVRRALVWGSDSFTLAKFRKMNNAMSAQSKQYSLTVEGMWHEEFEGETSTRGFLRVLKLVAESPQEALLFAREFEPAEVRESLTINNCEEIGSGDNLLKGVYEITGHVFFGE